MRGMIATIPIRRRSVVNIVRRRSQRSDTRAATVPPRAAGSSRSVRMPPTALVEDVTSQASAMSANVAIQSPRPETP